VDGAVPADPAIRTVLDVDPDRLDESAAGRRDPSIAASKAAWFLALGSRKPLTLRTNWRAAASSSPVVAASPGRRRVLMLRHMRLR
jgi:hypothetical protein